MENSKQKMFLIFHGRFPSEKAASLFAAKSAESFADAGINVTLLVPRRLGRVRSNPYAYYGVREVFKVTYLSTLDMFSAPIIRSLAFKLSFFVFSVASLVHLATRASRGDIIYSNEALPILFASFFFPRTALEVHDFPEKNLWFYRILYRRVGTLICTNRWKADRIRALFGMPGEHIVVEPNAVDLEEFDIPLSKGEARARLGLPADARIVVYTGHLYAWKGVDTLADAAKLMPEVLVIFVGGTEQDVARFGAQYGQCTNIRIVGHRLHAEIPVWQKAADVLVLPNTGREAISSHYTSPMKLFEYMASGRPIVASRVSSINEILPENAAYLVEADSPKVLAEGVRVALTESATERAERARKLVSRFSWEGRACRLLQIIRP